MTDPSLTSPQGDGTFDVVPLPTGEPAMAGVREPLDEAGIRPQRRRRDWGAGLGALWIVVIAVLAVLADWLPLLPPGEISDAFAQPPSYVGEHPLGTDQLGRDLLSRAIHGAQISLTVAVGATLLALLAGTIIGMAAGFLRGVTDSVFEVFTNVLLAFPPLIFLIAIVAALRPSASTLILGLALVGLSTFARISRANTIAFANREFVVAARALGASNIRILTRELLANVMLPVMSFALVVMASLVVAEGSLSFLGLGVPPPTPSWGGMIAQGREELDTTPHQVLVPAVFFFLTVFALNRLGDWARGKVGRQSAL